MTVRELIEELSKFPQEMPVITSMCSDYTDVEAPQEMEVVRQNGSWIRYYPHQWNRDDTGVPPLQRVVYFDGN